MPIAEGANIGRQSRISNALMTTRSTYRRFAKRRETRAAAAHALRNSLQSAVTKIVTALLPKEKFAAQRLTANL
jgi:hypothetical protein